MLQHTYPNKLLEYKRNGYTEIKLNRNDSLDAPYDTMDWQSVPSFPPCYIVEDKKLVRGETFGEYIKRTGDYYS